MAPRPIISRRALSLLSAAFLLGILGAFAWLYRYGFVDAESVRRPPLLSVGGVGDTKAAIHTSSSSSLSSYSSLATVASISASRLKPAPASTTPTAQPNMATPRPSPAADGAPTVRLAQGTYVGIVLPQSKRYPRPVEAFRGVPYAETTSGQNRFRPPVPRGESDLTFDVNEFGKICPIDQDAGSNEGEDCLNANIYRLVPDTTGPRPSPSASTGKLLPVVIYVHGGGFNGGSGTERNMASFISWAKHPLVAVNFNYRTGALGFLPSALTAREGLLNLGLKDQQMLFQWVQDNIAAFGGDPDNVTLMGLSAGAHSVSPSFLAWPSPPCLGRLAGYVSDPD